MQKQFSGLDDSSWENYKKSLKEAMEAGEELGISNRVMEQAAKFAGQYLAEKVNPDLPENKALKEMWQVADSREKSTIASLMVKLAKNS